jgi:hypothetical protein
MFEGLVQQLQVPADAVRHLSAAEPTCLFALCCRATGIPAFVVGFVLTPVSGCQAWGLHRGAAEGLRLTAGAQQFTHLCVCVPPFVLQLASNSSEFVSSLTFAARKRRKNMSLTLSQVGCCCLGCGGDDAHAS